MNYVKILFFVEQEIMLREKENIHKAGKNKISSQKTIFVCWKF